MNIKLGLLLLFVTTMLGACAQVPGKLEDFHVPGSAKEYAQSEKLAWTGSYCLVEDCSSGPTYKLKDEVNSYNPTGCPLKKTIIVGTSSDASKQAVVYLKKSSCKVYLAESDPEIMQEHYQFFGALILLGIVLLGIAFLLGTQDETLGFMVAIPGCLCIISAPIYLWIG